MLQTKSDRSYSDFFTSGFRAMTSRASRRTTPVSADPAISINTTTTTSSTRRISFRNITNRHSRTTSMIGLPTSINTNVPPRDRRSSIASFSSWLFDRKGSTAENAFTFSPSPQKNSRELHRSTEITEVWITAGGPFTPASVSRSSEDTSLFQTIDPFASSPDSKSIFIDLSESPTPPPNPKRESFLSFNSSPDRSFLSLPRRERPTSIHTMPLPSRSRRSSYYRPPSWGKSDYSWTLPEESGTSTESLAEDSEWVDPTYDIDWRQFHIELLSEEA